MIIMHAHPRQTDGQTVTDEHHGNIATIRSKNLLTNIKQDYKKLEIARDTDRCTVAQLHCTTYVH